MSSPFFAYRPKIKLGDLKLKISYFYMSVKKRDEVRRSSPIMDGLAVPAVRAGSIAGIGRDAARKPILPNRRREALAPSPSMKKPPP
jgi:hypothetical protein